MLNPFFSETGLLFFIKISGYIGVLKRVLIMQFNIFQVPLTLFLCSAVLVGLNIAVNLLL